MASPTSFAFKATPANTAAMLEALRLAKVDAICADNGWDADAYRAGHVIHLDRTFARFDRYAGDSDNDMARRQSGLPPIQQAREAA